MSKSTPRTLSQALNQLDKEARPFVEKKLEQLQELMEDLKPYLDEASEKAKEQVQDGVKYAKKTSKQIDEAVHEKPWVALGIVGLLALIIGFLLGSRRR